MNKEKTVTIINLLHAQAQIDKNSQFGIEVHSLANEYSNILLKNRFWDSKKILNYLFNQFMPMS